METPRDQCVTQNGARERSGASSELVDLLPDVSQVRVLLPSAEEQAELVRAFYWERVDKQLRGRTTLGERCWVWSGARNTNGYGVLQINWLGYRMLAHRYSYELHVAPIPAGLVIDHLCYETLCVNPHHLDPCTNEENIKRASVVYREMKRREQQLEAREIGTTHCPEGHPYTVLVSGRKACYPCQARRRSKLLR